MVLRRTIALLVLVLAGCTSAAPAASSSAATVPPTAPVGAPSVASPSPAAPALTISPAAPGETPPGASLAAEGGDPVTGQLGTYTWRETGSDSPWLPGAPIAIGAGEPLTVTLEPPASVATWRARLVPATADGPAGAVVLGRGSGPIVFAASAPGAWTVEVGVVFGDGLGTASYFWRLEVT